MLTQESATATILHQASQLASQAQVIGDLTFSLQRQTELCQQLTQRTQALDADLAATREQLESTTGELVKARAESEARKLLDAGAAGAATETTGSAAD